MRVFVDSSVVLAACASSQGASRELFRRARARKVELVTALWCLAEVERNLPKMEKSAATAWRHLQRHLMVVPTTVVLDRPLVFGAWKDRPVLVSALASASSCLLTLDRADFQRRIGRDVYDLTILTPGDWLRRQA